MLSFNFSVLFPLLAKRTFAGDVGLYATLLAVMGAGSMIGALAMARQKHPTPLRLAVAAAAFGIMTVIAATAPTLPLELAILLPLGASSMVFMIIGNSTLQLTSRPDMRGRVMALYGIVFLGGTPFGGPIAGWLADAFGPRTSLAVGGVVAIATGLAGLWTLGRLGLVKRRAVPSRRRQVVGVPIGTGSTDPELSAREELTA